MSLEVLNPPVNTAIPRLDTPSLNTFDYKQELGQVIARGVNHSLIHDLTSPNSNVCGLGLMMPSTSLPRNFPDDVKDPGIPSPSGKSWNELTSMEKKDLLFTSLTELREFNSRPLKEITFEEALSFYERYNERIKSIRKAYESLDTEVQKSEIGEMLERNIAICAAISQAQVDLGRPDPQKFNEFSLRNMLAEAVTFRPTGEGSYPPGFLRLGEVCAEPALVNSQKALLMRFITEATKNSFEAMKRLEQKPSPEIKGTKEYSCTVSLRELPDKTYEIVFRDNCGGIPEKYLKEDRDGIPGRPLMCNLKTSSQKGGVGTCEMFHIAKALGVTLEISNYEDPESLTKGAETRLSGLRLFEK